MKKMSIHLTFTHLAQTTATRTNEMSKAAARVALLKKCVLKNFAKFTGKSLCQSLFFNKNFDKLY